MGTVLHLLFWLLRHGETDGEVTVATGARDQNNARGNPWKRNSQIKLLESARVSGRALPSVGAVNRNGTECSSPAQDCWVLLRSRSFFPRAGMWSASHSASPSSPAVGTLSFCRSICGTRKRPA